MSENKRLINKNSIETNAGYESLPLTYSPNDTTSLLLNTHNNLKNSDNNGSRNDSPGENDPNNDSDFSKTPLLQLFQDSFLYRTSKKNSFFLY